MSAIGEPHGRHGVDGNIARSCVECRRLKRKCDREQPCGDCFKNGKTCSYVVPTRTPLTRTRLTTVEKSLDKLQHLLKLHAPHLDIDAELSNIDPARERSPSRARYSEGTDSPRRHESRQPEGRSYTPQQPDQIASSSRLPQQQWAQPTYPSPRYQQPPTPNPPSVLPEKQPKTAAGYEWDERKKGKKQTGDGTASLSIEPDGEGYLGFASGATLLRILQICAGGLHLPLSPSSSALLPGGAQTPAYEPSTEDMGFYIESYFKIYHPQYPLVHEASFRAQWCEVIVRPKPNDWAILLNTIIAIGAFCSRPDAIQIVDHFMDAATSRLNVSHLESGSLALVQAFTLLSNLAQKRNKPNSGSVYLGIAVRMAVGLGLHRELPLWDISPFEREVRRRVWWVLFIFDSGAAITFGRPILLPTSEADVEAVVNMNDLALTPLSKSIPTPLSSPTHYSSLVFQSSLHHLANALYTRTISTPPPSALTILDLISQLDSWRQALPPWFGVGIYPIGLYPAHEFAVYKLFWRYSNMKVIFLRRPFLERALKRLPLDEEGGEGEEWAERKCARGCLGGARESIRSIHEFLTTHEASPLEWWYALHFLFHASFFPLIALHTDPLSPSSPSWREDVLTAKSALQIRKGDALADRCLQIIHLLTPPSPSHSSEEAGMGADRTLAPAMAMGEGFGLFAGMEAEQMWGGDMAHGLLPLADYASLADFWPGLGG